MPKVSALLLPLLMGLSSTSYAQVYKSTDADGNVVYSDTPAAGGEEIQVPEANVADPVEAPAYVPPEPKPEVIVEEKPQPEVIVTTDDDDDGHMGMREKRRKDKHRQNREK